ncbi:hypothetical protein MEA186_33094 [Mesorhizobium amorphae CCNWGS0123]|uniref:Uncharacterized protein n=1 Tax=Mesorhizobium amorphae CCNWGS0123 TaxID=1082933 RepID=G6YKT3_9HYPH|nr:hypothetical protein MEA186_33094 [Mesorhizobium amorphae CCNWGS0123]
MRSLDDKIGNAALAIKEPLFFFNAKQGIFSQRSCDGEHAHQRVA